MSTTTLPEHQLGCDKHQKFKRDGTSTFSLLFHLIPALYTLSYSHSSSLKNNPTASIRTREKAFKSPASITSARPVSYVPRPNPTATDRFNDLYTLEHRTSTPCSSRPVLLVPRRLVPPYGWTNACFQSSSVASRHLWHTCRGDDTYGRRSRAVGTDREAGYFWSIAGVVGFDLVWPARARCRGSASSGLRRHRAGLLRRIAVWWTSGMSGRILHRRARLDAACQPGKRMPFSWSWIPTTKP